MSALYINVIWLYLQPILSVILKILDKLIVKSFVGPALMSYFVATFVLDMQLLWKYVDEILGKGLSVFEILELIFYHSMMLIPMAVPISILISSVMVYGDMAEKYELSSIKSAGVSLLRIMAPGILVAFVIGLFSIFASNYLKPKSALQFTKRFQAIRLKSSTLAFEEGVFNNDFGETVIRINKIDKNKRDIEDILIFNHNKNDKSLVEAITAASGEMFTLEGRYFVMKLDTGILYQEDMRRSSGTDEKIEYPFTRTYFDEWLYTMDMSIFDISQDMFNLTRDRDQMLNSRQLLQEIDSLSKSIHGNEEVLFNKMDKILKVVDKNVGDNQHVKQDNVAIDITQQNPRSLRAIMSLEENSDPKDTSIASNEVPMDTLRMWDKQWYMGRLAASKDISNIYLYAMIDSLQRNDVLTQAMIKLQRDRDDIYTTNTTSSDYKKMVDRYLLRLNNQYSWAAVCFLFLFIGAPLGSIIRKGGYGYPLLIAILFYMIFIMSTIYGEKLVKNGDIGGIRAAWIPCLILLPFAILLTYMALRDMKLNTSAIGEFVDRIWKRKIN